MHVSVAWLTLGLPDRGKCPRMKARANARREYKVVLFRGHLGGHVFLRSTQRTQRAEHHQGFAHAFVNRRFIKSPGVFVQPVGRFCMLLEAERANYQAQKNKENTAE